MMTGVAAAYLRTPRVKSAAAVYFLIAGALTQLPLFNYLGYEFSAVMTIPAAFITGWLTLHWLKDHRQIPLSRRGWLSVLSVYLMINTLLLLIPLVVISLNAIVVKNCAFPLGLLYYLLLPFVTMAFATPLALVIGILFRRSGVIYTIVVCGLLLHIALITVFQPQLFAYNFILGFFPGITYDETQTDLGALFLYRGFTILAALMLFSLFFILLRSFGVQDRLKAGTIRMRQNFRRDAVLWAAAGVCAVILGSAHIFRDDLGFEYSAEDIHAGLGRRSESTHFIVYYRHDDYPAQAMQRLKAEMEFHFRMVSDRLALDQRRTEKIAVYIYPDADWKQRYIGTATTNIAKPWLRQIHLTTGSFTGTFRHELVHVLAGEFGIPFLRASVRMGLNEGLAVATDWDEGMFSPHQYAAAIGRDGGLDDAARLFTLTGFATRSNTYAYIVTGSFIRYLIDRFGIERVREVFPTGNFVTIFGTSLGQLMADWKAFLRTVDATEIPPMTVEALFASPSIFFKTCPRTVAEQNKNATFALREQRFSEAERLFSASFDNAPSVSALRGLYHTWNALGRSDRIPVHFDSLPRGSLLRRSPSILLSMGDAYAFTGQEQKALEQYRAILTMNISETFMETSLLRQQYLADGVDTRVLRILLYSGASVERRIAVIDSVRRYHPASAALAYQAALLTESVSITSVKGLPPGLQFSAFIRAAEQAFVNGAFEQAKGLFWQAKNVAPTGTISERLDERIELCDFTIAELQ